MANSNHAIPRIRNALNASFYTSNQNLNKNQEEKEAEKMKKIISIEGMMCNHCKKKVEKIY